MMSAAPPGILPESGARAGAAAEAMAGRPPNKRPYRLCAHIHLHMRSPGFDLVPMLIGKGGQNMRKIAEATGAKLRVRGRGSGHLEVQGKREAPTPLMLAVTTEKNEGLPSFKAALEKSFVELRIVEKRYKLHCEKEGTPHEGPCFSVGYMTDGIQELLGDALQNVSIGAFTSSTSRKEDENTAASAKGEIGHVNRRLQLQ